MAELFKGLEEARVEFNNWQGNAVIFIDFEDMTVWTDVFEIPTYHSDSIVSLISKDDLYGRNDRYNYMVLEKLAKTKHKDYKEGFAHWQIEDDYRYAEVLY